MDVLKRLAFFIAKLVEAVDVAEGLRVEIRLRHRLYECVCFSSCVGLDIFLSGSTACAGAFSILPCLTDSIFRYWELLFVKSACSCTFL